MADEKGREKQATPNEISAETGQFDARFMLWRRFCADNDIAVDTLPGDLKGKAKELWESLKNEQLHKDSQS
ncbi:MAG TPA: hypothetical protein VFX96_10845 [Pyrinomonadaceae bacterium]|nr:hypothetical protein [Pyrinomonadaceae bacterium]